MASSLCSSCTWPPAVHALWRSLFKQHYSSSSFSKWHQLYVDTSCVLLGLKSALLVDYISPDAKKLQLYLNDVAKTIHDSTSKESTVKCRSPDAECQFCRSLRDCCVLTIGEDILLVNTRRLAQDWGIDSDHLMHDDSKLMGHTLSLLSLWAHMHPSEVAQCI